jgi:hypothetical protein
MKNICRQPFYTVRLICIAAGALDVGNDPPTLLRSGLLLGQRTTDCYYAPYDPNGDDGLRVGRVILIQEVNMLDPFTETPSARVGQAIDSGYVDIGSVIGLDVRAVLQMQDWFEFFDGTDGDVRQFIGVRETGRCSTEAWQGVR